MTRRRLAIVALQITILATLGVAPRAAASVAARGSCTRPLVIGVAGSGERKAGSSGYGATVLAAVRKFLVSYGGRADAEALNYPARDVKDLFATEGRKNRYRSSVDTGISRLVARLNKEADACPTRVIALVGYSQGALVVNRALVQLANVGAPVLAHIGAVELIADPQRRGSAVYAKGSAEPGFSGVSIAAGFYPPDDIPSGLHPRTDSFCEAGDIVCAPDPAQGLVGTVQGFLIHMKTYVEQGIAETAGKNAAGRTKMLARTLRQAPALDLSGFIGDWSGHPLTLRIAADGTTNLVFAELNPDGSDQVIGTIRITERSGSTASGTIETNPGASSLIVPFDVGTQVTFRLVSATELEVDPQGISFCGPDSSCEAEGFEP